MAKNLNFHFDNHGIPRARGKQSEKLLMSFLESDVQGSEYICHDLMNDITAVDEGSVESREFIGNAYSVNITADGVVISSNLDDIAAPENAGSDSAASKDGTESSSAPDVEYKTSLKHFSEVLADWEAFILDEEDPIDDSMHV